MDFLGWENKMHGYLGDRETGLLDRNVQTVEFTSIF